MNSSPKLLRKVSLILCFVIGAALGIPALEAIAADTPCSGRKGGIAGGDLVVSVQPPQTKSSFCSSLIISGGMVVFSRGAGFVSQSTM